MNKLERAKLIIGFIFIGFGLLGILDAFFVLDLYNWSWIRDSGGYNSNLPVFYGLSAIAGTMLVNSVK